MKFLRHTLLFSVIILLTAFHQPLAGGQKQADEKTGKLNFVIFIVDDLGWSDIGVMGNQDVLTPNIDRLAKKGMLFTDAYSNSPVCSPTRASLMTGLYGPRHGLYMVNRSNRGIITRQKLLPPPTENHLHPDFVTLPEILKKGGYISANIGKWHLGEGETGPIAQGFDVNVAGGTPGMITVSYTHLTLPTSG